jgi:hypothetical protein
MGRSGRRKKMEGVNPTMYIVRTFKNVTMYTQYNNNLKNNNFKKREMWKLSPWKS